MHIDLNSCFASIEQQDNPRLRSRPTVVAAYTTGNGCILAASQEAKSLGIHTGMPVFAAQTIYPRVVVLPPRPTRYRDINRQFTELLSSYTPHLSVESIDELVLDLENTPLFYTYFQQLNFLNNIHERAAQVLIRIGQIIKLRIKEEIGEWLTVSIGVAPNRYLAKIASNLKKPDGLEVITRDNILSIFSRLKLTELTGIKDGSSARLATSGITTALALAVASPEKLKSAFHSIVGYQWWLRMHGFEDGGRYQPLSELKELPQKTLGHSFALGRPHLPNTPEIYQIISQLIGKLGKRLRGHELTAGSIGIFLYFCDGTHWKARSNGYNCLITDYDFATRILPLLKRAPEKLVRLVAITSFSLIKNREQLLLFPKEQKVRNLNWAVDRINGRFGELTIHPARLVNMEQKVLDRIAFGKTT